MCRQWVGDERTVEAAGSPLGPRTRESRPPPLLLHHVSRVASPAVSTFNLRVSVEGVAAPTEEVAIEIVRDRFGTDFTISDIWCEAAGGMLLWRSWKSRN